MSSGAKRVHRCQRSEYGLCVSHLSCDTRAATRAGSSSSSTDGDLATSLLMSVLGSASRNRMSLLATACASNKP